MRTLPRWRLAHIPLATLTLACQGSTGLFGSFASTYDYTVTYSDSGPRSFAGSFAGFSAYPEQSGTSNGQWAAVYLIGDSLQVTEVLPSNTQCPVSHTVPVGTTLTADSATVIVRHKRISATNPDPSISSLTIDSVAAGQVWGRLSLSLHPVVPEFVDPSATVTGRFQIAEIEYMGFVRHCTRGAA